MRSQHSYGLCWMSVRRKIPAKSLARIEELMGEVEPPLGLIRGVKPGSLEDLQLESTILRSWIALHLKPEEVVDIDGWVRKKID